MSPQAEAEKYHHQKRYLGIAYGVLAALYFLIGVVLIIAERFRTRIPYFTDWPNANQVMPIPSGSDDQAVRAYYDYLHNWQLMKIQETYFFQPSMVTWIYAGIGMLIIIFLFITYIWHIRHRQGDLYPVEVYNGYISERGGKVDYFNWAVFSIVGSFALYYAATNLIYGQIY